MKERIIRLYREGRLTTAGLANAVARGWLAQTEADELIVENTTAAQDEMQLTEGK